MSGGAMSFKEKEEEVSDHRPGVMSSWVEKRPELQGLKPFEPNTQYLEQLHPKLGLPKMSRKILEVFSSTEETSEAFAAVVASNPYYAEALVDHVKAVGGKEDRPHLTTSLVMLGMSNSRDFLLAVQQERHFLAQHITAQDDGKIQLQEDGQKTLHFALEAEKELDHQKNSSSFKAYAAGYAYSWLNRLIKETVEHAKQLEPAIDSIFKKNLNVARVSHALSAEISGFPSRPWAFGLGLLSDIGRLIMMIENAEAIDFYSKVFDLRLPRAVTQHLEMERFGIYSCSLGGLFCRDYSFFSNYAAAVSGLNAPKHLLGVSSEVRTMSSLLRFSNNIVDSFYIPESPVDPCFEVLNSPEVGFSALSNQQIVDALKPVKLS